MVVIERKGNVASAKATSSKLRKSPASAVSFIVKGLKFQYTLETYCESLTDQTLGVIFRSLHTNSEQSI